MNINYLRFSLHGMGWLAFLLLPYLFSMRGAIDLSQLFRTRHDVQTLMTNGLLIGFSYWNYLFLVPRLYLTKRRVAYFSWVMGCFTFIALVNFWSEPLVRGLPIPPKPYLTVQPALDALPPQPSLSLNRGQLKPRSLQPPPFYHDLSQVILVFVVSVLVSVSVQISSRLKQLEIDKLQAELGQLKAQIQPHFLFNTLNSIYALAIRKDDKTADTVVKLAEFMRYITREATHSWVPLEKELAYIQNYLDLQRSRLRKSVQLSYSVEGSPTGHQVAPLILFTFIENAFKHGVNPEEDSPIQITIRIGGPDLVLTVFNRKVIVQHPETDGGLGLVNTQARLTLIYPQRHQLTIHQTPNTYSVTLRLTQI